MIHSNYSQIFAFEWILPEIDLSFVLSRWNILFYNEFLKKKWIFILGILQTGTIGINLKEYSNYRDIVYEVLWTGCKYVWKYDPNSLYTYSIDTIFKISIWDEFNKPEQKYSITERIKDVIFHFYDNVYSMRKYSFSMKNCSVRIMRHVHERHPPRRMRWAVEAAESFNDVLVKTTKSHWIRFPTKIIVPQCDQCISARMSI